MRTRSSFSVSLSNWPVPMPHSPSGATAPGFQKPGDAFSLSGLSILLRTEVYNLFLFAFHVLYFPVDNLACLLHHEGDGLLAYMKMFPFNLISLGVWIPLDQEVASLVKPHRYPSMDVPGWDLHFELHHSVMHQRR